MQNMLAEKELIVPRYWREKIDDRQIKEFLRVHNLMLGSSKEASLVNLFNHINKLDQDADFFDDLNLFLIETVKYTTNRIAIEIPIRIRKGSDVMNFEKLLGRMNLRKKDFFVNELLDSVTNVKNNAFVNNNGEFELIYRDAIFSNTSKSEPLIIEEFYVREVEYATKRNNILEKYKKFEFVCCEIDIKKSSLKIFISNNNSTTDKNQTDGTISNMAFTFCNQLSEIYDFSRRTVDYSKTLFNMFKDLTSKLEQPYTNQVTPYSKEIEKFSTDMMRKLKIENKEDIGIKTRIFKLFERNLIQKDFERIKKQYINDGRVKYINFKDGTGSTVNATTGGKKESNGETYDLNMEDSNVYFDTRETIYSLEKLGVVVVEWKTEGKLKNKEDRYEKIVVTYTAHPGGYYSSRINRVNLNKEVSDFVLSKFGTYQK